jgi:murein L,D-transpeptidase YafK
MPRSKTAYLFASDYRAYYVAIILAAKGCELKNKHMKRIACMLLAAPVWVATTSLVSKKAHYPSEFILIVDKSDHSLKVYQGDRFIKEYLVVFGNNDIGDKMMAGDRKTPEGTYHISYMRKHEKWNRFMLIDYPSKADYAKFNQRKAAGLIPKNAKIGGDIGVHGTWPHDEPIIDRKYNWTLGCISMKNEDVEELYDNVVVGTTVIIQ